VIEGEVVPRERLVGAVQGTLKGRSGSEYQSTKAHVLRAAEACG
jgi:hypothetical protein